MMHEKSNLLSSFLQQQKKWHKLSTTQLRFNSHLLITILANSGQNYPYIFHAFTWSALIMTENIFFSKSFNCRTLY